MKIKEKINLDYNGLIEHGAITIVAFGDSVTHGAFDDGEIDYDAVYHNLLKKKIIGVNNYVPVNVINAGIGGSTAKIGVQRIDKQVLCHNPDLVTVCFGLNDVNGTLEEYLNSLSTIFEKCKNADAEVIFLTPNTLNSYVSKDVKPHYADYAVTTSEYQNSGKMDEYIYSAVELAKKSNVKVCDCYSKWKELAKTCDTTELLANKINHPIREMHELFAQSLFEIIMGD